MTWAHVHLLLNHIPVIGMGFGVLLLLVGWVKNSEQLKLVSLQGFVLLGVIALPTYLTGDPAADMVQSLPGVSKQVIERHEDAALAALIGIIVLGLLALAAVIVSRRTKTLPAWMITASFALSLIVTGLMVRAANLGGQIRHSEIRAGVQVTLSPD